MRYALDIVRASRPKSSTAPDFIKKWVAFGASVRAAQYLVLGGKARALTSGRYHVSFDDIRALAHPVLRHRVLTNFHAQSEGVTTRSDHRIVCSTSVPMPRSRSCNERFASRGHAQQHSRRPLRRSRRSSRASGISSCVARAVVDGFINGLHRAPYFGASVDFAEHRGYMPGDDIRRVDWRLCARTDRYYVKEYEAESNTNFSVLLDVSKSMRLRQPRHHEARLRAHPRGVPDLSRAPAARPRRARDVRRTTSSITCRRRPSTWKSCCTCSTRSALEGPGSSGRRCRNGGALRAPRHARPRLGSLRGAATR